VLKTEGPSGGGAVTLDALGAVGRQAVADGGDDKSVTNGGILINVSSETDDSGSEDVRAADADSLSTVLSEIAIVRDKVQ